MDRFYQNPIRMPIDIDLAPFAIKIQRAWRGTDTTFKIVKIMHDRLGFPISLMISLRT